MRINLEFGLFVTAAAFSPSLFGQSNPAKQSAKIEDEIRVVVLRHQMLEWVHEQNQAEADAKDEMEAEVARALNVKVFFISVNGKDPTDGFMKRFRDVPRTLKKASRGNFLKDMQYAIFDRDTNLHGVISRADSVRWLKNGSAEIEGGYFYDGLYAATEAFRLRLINGKRRIVSTGMRRIF